MRTIGDDERRARLARRHGLVAGAALRRRGRRRPARSAALHATDPATVFLAARARLAEPSVAAIESALYEERTLVRMLGMRRTMFVVPAALAGVIHASSTRALIPGERKRFAALLEATGVTRRRRALAARGRGGDVRRARRARRGDDRRARRGRPGAEDADAGRAGQALRGQPGRLVEDHVPARRRGADRARAPAAARGRARCIAGRRRRPGCPRRWPSSTPTSRRPSSCAAGWPRSGRARTPT